MSALEQIERLFHEKIPLSRAMQVRAVSYDGSTLILSAPLMPNSNHLGTAFGGSLHSIATLCCYGWLWLELQDSNAHIVVKSSTVTYQAPVQGDLLAVCHRPAEDALHGFTGRLAAKGKARLTLHAEVLHSETTAVSYTGEFVVLT